MITKEVSLPTLNFHQFNPRVTFGYVGHQNTQPIARMTMYHYPSSGNSFQMGYLQWNSHTGEVLNVETHPDAQRLGVANTLLHESKNIAKEKGIALPQHSSNRTDEGNKWAKSTGDKVPKRKR